MTDTGDTRTIAAKELQEIIAGRTGGRRESRRSVPFRTLVFPILVGVFFGLQTGNGAGGFGVFFVGAMAMSTSLALVSDTIAGERERHTLETLLASPVSDGAILRGKLVAIVAYAWVVALLELAVIEIVSVAVGHGLPARSVGLVAILSLLDAALAVGFGVQFSLRAPTVRLAARKVGQLSFFVVVPVSAINSLAVVDIDIDEWWYPVALGSAIVVLVVATFALLALAQARFRRGQLLLD